MNIIRKPSEIGVEEISFYYEEMVRSNLLELEIETPNGKIQLKRLGHDAAKALHPLRRKSDFYAGPSGSGSGSEASAPAVAARTVNSPIMGVFYRASSPQSPPLVKENDVVDAGVTLCIVEAMKVMNEIKADIRCRIVRIMVENAKPVTKGQPLFHVEPAS